MIQRGASSACSAGYPKPTTAQCILHGFIAAARLSPLPLPEDKVPLLVCSALFDIDPTEKPDARLVEIVEERLLTALHRHLQDDDFAFEKWFLGPKNSLVHQLSKQKRSPGGELEEGEVRKVLLHFGWQAYEFASNCVRAQMRTFQNALPHSLTATEKLLFEHMHLPQPYLANLPLVLIIPRFGFCKGVLWEIWEHLPDLSRVPILYRMLDYYCTLATRRRQADRLIKGSRPVEFKEKAYVPSDQSDVFQEIAAEIRDIHKIDCGCPRREWYAELEGRPRTKVRILHRCLQCAYEQETTLTREEFAEIGRSIL